MGARKGTRPPNAGKGRPKGIPNKSTRLMKDVFAQLYADQSQHFDKWITQVADGIKEPEPVLDENGQPSYDENGEPKVEWNWLIRPDPHGAMKLALEAAEFVRPKLARTELTGEGGGAVKVEGTIEFIGAVPGTVPGES